MATITETMEKSEKLEAQKEKEMKSRQKQPRKSKCGVLKLKSAGLATALALLGVAVQDNLKLQTELERIPPHSSIETAVLTNMTDELATLRKQNGELKQAQETLKNLIENNPTSETQPYSREMWLRRQIEEAEQGKKKVDDSKAVVKSSKARKKGGYFNEHFNLTF